MLASKVVTDVSGVEAAGTFGDIELDATVAFAPDGASAVIAVVPAESERGGTSFFLLYFLVSVRRSKNKG